jgi:hypothetical protein
MVLVIYGDSDGKSLRSILAHYARFSILLRTLFEVRRFAESNSDLRPQLAHEVNEIVDLCRSRWAPHI